MPTLDELMKDKVPGSVKVTTPRWTPNGFFVPYFKDSEGCWHGPDESGEPFEFNSSGVWHLYTDPPKTTRKTYYRAWFKFMDSVECCDFYATPEMAKRNADGNPVIEIETREFEIPEDK